MAPGPTEPPAVALRVEVIPVLLEVATRGQISRGEVFRLIGMSERSGRDILGSLFKKACSYLTPLAALCVWDFPRTLPATGSQTSIHQRKP